MTSANFLLRLIVDPSFPTAKVSRIERSFVRISTWLPPEAKDHRARVVRSLKQQLVTQRA